MVQEDVEDSDAEGSNENYNKKKQPNSIDGLKI